MKRLSPMQRGYLIGLRRARAKAQRERDEMADRFEDAIGQVHAEMRGVRDEKAQMSAFGGQTEIFCSIRALPVLNPCGHAPLPLEATKLAGACASVSTCG